MRFAFDGVERFALKTAVAYTAGETADVEHAVHGRTAGAFADNLQTAIGTHSYSGGKRDHTNHTKTRKSNLLSSSPLAHLQPLLFPFFSFRFYFFIKSISIFI